MARLPSPAATRRLFSMAAEAVGAFLPDTWKLDVIGRSDTGGSVRLAAPDDAAAVITVMVRDRLATREAAALPEQHGPTLIAASWLSRRTRELLVDGLRGGEGTE